MTEHVQAETKSVSFRILSMTRTTRRHYDFYKYRCCHLANNIKVLLLILAPNTRFHWANPSSSASPYRLTRGIEQCYDNVDGRALPRGTIDLARRSTTDRLACSSTADGQATPPTDRLDQRMPRPAARRRRSESIMRLRESK